MSRVHLTSLQCVYAILLRLLFLLELHTLVFWLSSQPLFVTCFFFFFFQAEDGIRDHCVTGVQTCALPISFMDSALTMGVCSVLLGFSLGSVQPMVMSMLHQITPEHRHGEALGLRLMAINADRKSVV